MGSDKIIVNSSNFTTNKFLGKQRREESFVPEYVYTRLVISLSKKWIRKRGFLCCFNSTFDFTDYYVIVTHWRLSETDTQYAADADWVFVCRDKPIFEWPYIQEINSNTADL